jgi:thiol-disulfide isomerase/thioredoxin
MNVGMLNEPAPELRAPVWIDGGGVPTGRPLRLADLGDGPKILLAFQHWCPGCHSRGFPTLRRLYDALSPRGVGFAAIQTVFEGEEVNTVDKLRVNQTTYGLPIPFGHDAPMAQGRLPTFMQDYRTGGTPWFTVIDAGGRVAFADFHMDADRVLEALLSPGLEPAGLGRAMPPLLHRRG